MGSFDCVLRIAIHVCLLLDTVLFCCFVYCSCFIFPCHLFSKSMMATRVCYMDSLNYACVYMCSIIDAPCRHDLGNHYTNRLQLGVFYGTNQTATS